MKVKELKKDCKSEIKVLSGFNGKMLCKSFDIDKHKEIAEREVTAIWSEILLTNSGYDNYAYSIICVYVEGEKEARAYFDKKTR